MPRGEPRRDALHGHAQLGRRIAALPQQAALVAVGGYGRGELFPYSDVDVLILLHEAPDQAVRSHLEEFVQMLWDLGLDVGHSIRTIDECMAESKADITVQTSLLEARLVTGNMLLFGQLEAAYDKAMDPRAFFEAKTIEIAKRGDRQTVNINIKGLEDLRRMPAKKLRLLRDECRKAPGET